MRLKDEKEKTNIGKRKVVVDIGEHRKSWIENVARVSGSKISDVFRALIDQAIMEDPENYVGKMDKYKVKAELDDIERQEKALEEKKRSLVERLEGKGRTPDRIPAR